MYNLLLADSYPPNEALMRHACPLLIETDLKGGLQGAGSPAPE